MPEKWSNRNIRGRIDKDKIYFATGETGQTTVKEIK